MNSQTQTPQKKNNAFITAKEKKGKHALNTVGEAAMPICPACSALFSRKVRQLLLQCQRPVPRFFGGTHMCGYDTQAGGI